jgi:hypothetical protein
MLGLEINFKTFPLGDILQFLCRVEKTGVLRISGGDSGEIYLENGIVVHATDNFGKGMTALLNLSFGELTTGQFIPDANPPERTISGNFGKLTENLEKRRIEFEEIKKRLPRMDTVLVKSTKDLESAVALRRTDWQILALVDGKRTVKDVIAESKVAGYEATKTIIWLKEQGLIYAPKEVEEVMAELIEFLRFLFDIFGTNGPKWLHAWGALHAENSKIVRAVRINEKTMTVEPIAELDSIQIQKGLKDFEHYVRREGPAVYGKVLFRKKWQDFERRYKIR